MPSVPLPFVVALLLLILGVRTWRASEDRRGQLWFIALLLSCLLHAVVVGLRWGYGWSGLAPVQSLLAALLPPLLWLSFSRLRADGASSVRILLFHALGPVLVAATWCVYSPWVDPLLSLLYLGYGLALLFTARRGPDALLRSRLDAVATTQHLLIATAVALLSFAAGDIYIALRLAADDVDHAVGAIGFAQLMLVLLLGWVAVGLGMGQAEEEPATSANPSVPPAEPEDPCVASDASAGVSPVDDQLHDAVLAQVEALLGHERLYCDADLSLGRLARRVVLPARQISAAINVRRSMNVSQYINSHRIAEACRMLTTGSLPVTQIQLEVGFNSKSNFNREFQRITGTTPSAWRERKPADEL
jgi:AraC-like DNA-binding protein